MKTSEEGVFDPTIWVAYSVTLATVPSVVFKDEQLLVIKISTAKGDLFYGFVHAANNYVIRRNLWALMLEWGLHNIYFLGDFNAILGAEEQLGQRCLSRISCDKFRHCIADSGLTDLETTGPFFTWRCSGSSRVLMSRIDRVLASEDFLIFWSSISVVVLPRTISDHHPLLMKCLESSSVFVKPFRFQNFWTSHKDFSKVVSDS